MQRIFHGKNGPNSPDFEFFFYIFFKLPDFYDKFQHVAQEYRTILFFSFPTFISSMQPNLAKLFCEWSTLQLHHKSLKGNLAPTVKAQWQKRDIRALKMLRPTRICWRIHKQSMEYLTQQRSFMCAEHYTHGGLHTGIYGIWNVLQGAGVYTLTTFHTIPYWWATTFFDLEWGNCTRAMVFPNCLYSYSYWV